MLYECQITLRPFVQLKIIHKRHVHVYWLQYTRDILGGLYLENFRRLRYGSEQLFFILQIYNVYLEVVDQIAHSYKLTTIPGVLTRNVLIWMILKSV